MKKIVYIVLLIMVCFININSLQAQNNEKEKVSKSTSCGLQSGFTYTNDICEYVFTSTATVPTPYIITNYTWDFGDGTSINSGLSVNSVVHSYVPSGSNMYTVVLTVEATYNGEVCVDIFSQTITVDCDACSQFANADFTSSITDCDVTFNNTSSITAPLTITGYVWDFGDGNTSTQVSPSHTYSANDTYTVELTVTAELNGFVCTDTITNTVSTNCNTSNCNGETYFDVLVTDCNVTVSNLIANPTNFNYTVTGYLWDFGDGNTSTAMLPTHTYQSNGNYFVSLTVTFSGNGETCEDTITQQVTVTNCDSPCENHLFITQNVPSGMVDLQEAAITITAINTIETGGEATYHAGEEVLLDDGFTVEENAIFAAYIEGCSGEITNDCGLDTPANTIDATINGSYYDYNLSWDPVVNSVGYQIEIIYNDPQCCPGFGQPITITETTTNTVFPINISTPDFCLAWRVRALCDPTLGSEWSDKRCITFLFPRPAKLNSQTINEDRIRLYPNPTKNGQNVSIVSREFNIDDITIYNSIGVEMPIRLHKINDLHVECNLNSSLTSGLYLVKIIVNNQAIFKRLIIE